MTACIFLGPSLPIAEAQSIAPEVSFRPPAEQGDLVTAAVRDGADLIGLVDGTFHQNLSVWHNELCFLLSKGVTLVGASSMGALRAAETRQFGMIGIGRIYEWYRDGVVSGDDEVALLHSDEELGYRGESLPLVNVRATLADAVDAGALSRSLADTALEICRSIFYAERTRASIRSRLQEELSSAAAATVERVLSESYVEQKSIDARELLRYVHDLATGRIARPEPVSFQFSRSASFETLYNLDREISPPGTPKVTLQTLVEHVALNDPQFEKLRREALHRDLVLFLASLVGVRPTAEEVAEERDLFLNSRNLSEPDKLTTWLGANDLTESDLAELVTQEALCRKLRWWVIATRSFDRGARSLMDLLRLEGAYPDWRQRALAADARTRAYATTGQYDYVNDLEPAHLAERYADMTGVAIEGDAAAWAEMNGFDGTSGLLNALRGNFIAQDVRRRVERVKVALADSRDTLAAPADIGAGGPETSQ